MKKTIGILAHVDAGKTTFSEQLLFHTKSIRTIGRVDHQNAHLDLHEIEQQRGITVFAEQATFTYRENDYTVIDTPGHVDFAAEMERSIMALDGAILLLNGTDGVQGHTETVYRLLRKYRIPTLFFVNKMDLISANAATVTEEIQQELMEYALPFHDWATGIEEFAGRDEQYLEDYLEESLSESEWQKRLSKAFMVQELSPILYGSALKDEGIDFALEVLDTLLQPQHKSGELQGMIYKIRHIEQNQRMAFIKIHQGSLKVRDDVRCGGNWFKITQIRKYHGKKFEELQRAEAGDTVAIIGLKEAKVGMGVGEFTPSYEIDLRPTMRTQIVYEGALHPKELLAYCRLLEAEDPALSVTWQEETQKITLHIMGEIQLEVLQQIFEERFSEQIAFTEPTIIYKETIQQTVRGYGHFEPLKHYAEVHLQIEPNERGAGIEVMSKCHPNDLAIGLQNMIQQSLIEKKHRGILTGSEITDLRVTILTGRSHPKHTEGGDFREATLRALRQGLEQAENQLLEPYYSFSLKVHHELFGRIVTDVTNRHAQVDEPQFMGEQVYMTGRAPVATMRDYPIQFAASTNGRGSLQLRVDGYDVCHNAEEVIEQMAYQKDADPEYSSNSVFCAKGKGYSVHWTEAKEAMHCPMND